ncbi:MAG TPA: ribulose-phosphate 3-epimerase [Saprospiraceae bacterium]|nr:ribulose-phosphate 3-epimerase [Saprospiraceae bacterium]
MAKHLIAPSILAADFGNLQRDVEMINGTEADWFHIDIMDGMFVPNISFGPEIVSVIKKSSKLPLDVHLMIEKPERYIEQYRKSGADNISVHIEACPHLHRTIQQIKATGAKAGVAINPHTSVDLLQDIIGDLDLVILMSVNPGFGGQKFIYQTLKKIEKLKEMIIVENTATLIEIDGGVGLQNAESILNAGADVLVAGNSVFGAENQTLAVYALKNLGIKGLYA